MEKRASQVLGEGAYSHWHYTDLADALYSPSWPQRRQEVYHLGFLERELDLPSLPRLFLLNMKRSFAHDVVGKVIQAFKVRMV